MLDPVEMLAARREPVEDICHPAAQKEEARLPEYQGAQCVTRSLQCACYHFPASSGEDTGLQRSQSQDRSPFDSPQALDSGLPSGHAIAMTGLPKIRFTVEKTSVREDAA